MSHSAYVAILLLNDVLGDNCVIPLFYVLRNLDNNNLSDILPGWLTSFPVLVSDKNTTEIHNLFLI